MYSPNTKPRVAVSKSGDILIIQGPAQPALFVPHSKVATLLDHPENVTAIMIVDVGVAAIRTVLAAGAVFDAIVSYSEADRVHSVTLRFYLGNGLVVGYTTDDALAGDSDKLNQLGIDLVVTDSAIDWKRQHTQFVGQVIASVSTEPAQVVGLSTAAHQQLVPLIRAALQVAGPSSLTQSRHD